MYSKGATKQTLSQPTLNILGYPTLSLFDVQRRRIVIEIVENVYDCYCNVVVDWDPRGSGDGVGLPRVLSQAQGASRRVNILLSGPSLGLGPIDLHICLRVRVWGCMHTYTRTGLVH